MAKDNYKDPMWLLKHDPFVGKQLISFHEIGWDSRADGLKCGCDLWWIASTSKFKYGKIGGGSKNLGCFIDWLQGKGAWCYNPIDMNDYVWSPINHAYMRKDYPFLHIQIMPVEQYTFRRKDCSRGDLV